MTKWFGMYLVVALVALVACQEEAEDPATPDVQTISPPSSVPGSSQLAQWEPWLPTQLVLPGWGLETPEEQIGSGESIWYGTAADCLAHVDFTTQFGGGAAASCLEPFGEGITEATTDDGLCLRVFAEATAFDLRTAAEFGRDVMQGVWCAVMQAGLTTIPGRGEETLGTAALTAITTETDVSSWRLVISQEESGDGTVWYRTEIAADDSSVPAWTIALRNNESGGVLSGRLADRHASGKDAYFSWEYDTLGLTPGLTSGHLVSEVRFAAMTPETSPLDGRGLFDFNTGAVFDEPTDAAFGSYANDAAGIVIEQPTRLLSHWDVGNDTHHASVWSNETGYYFENAYLQVINHSFSTQEGCLVAGVPSLEDYGVSIRRSIRESGLSELPVGSEDRATADAFSATVDVQCYVVEEGVFVSDATLIEDGYLHTNINNIQISRPLTPATGDSR